MSRLVWDNTGERLYETGVKRGVLYPAVNGEYPAGVVWNGLTSVSENPSGPQFLRILQAQRHPLFMRMILSIWSLDLQKNSAPL